ncbi:hypothetical protein KEM56_003276 [Ascosphaera pollenicola]|nr:hypothetical protein KEM56_003276 [Ascosphaera pollenicola]
MAYWRTTGFLLRFVSDLFQYQILKKCPPGSIDRYLLSLFAFGPMIASVYCLCKAEFEYAFPDVTVPALMGIIPLFYTFRRLIASDFSLADVDVAQSKKGDDAKTVGGLRQFCDTFTNIRRINHYDQAKNVPHFSQWPNVPSKLQFLTFRCVRMALLYIAFDLVNNLAAGDKEVDMDPWCFPQLWKNSFPLEDSIGAVACALMYLLNGYLILNIQYDAISVVAVATNIDTPKDWPPLFGSISQSYTMRRFWGTFWHQILRKMVESISSFVVHTVLHVPKPQRTPGKQGVSALRLFARYSKLLCAFAVSGLLHLTMDVGTGLQFSESRSFRYFVIQAVGIMFEDMVEAAWEKAFGGSDSEKGVSRWRKAIGFVWVVIFSALTVPMWVVPIAKLVKDVPPGPVSFFLKA